MTSIFSHQNRDYNWTSCPPIESIVSRLSLPHHEKLGSRSWKQKRWRWVTISLFRLFVWFQSVCLKIWWRVHPFFLVLKASEELLSVVSDSAKGITFRNFLGDWQMLLSEFKVVLQPLYCSFLDLFTTHF